MTNTEAKRLLKNVKGDQFVSNDRFNETHYMMGTYKKLEDISRTTEKAIFILTPEHPEDFKTGYWVPKSVILFNLKSNKNGVVDISMKFNDKYTNVYKENLEASRSDSNSIWCDIFRKQDQNGLTANGYAM